MDMQTPNHTPFPSPAGPGGPPSRGFIKHLLQTLAATTPGATPDDMTAWSDNWQNTCELFEALNPGDAAEAQLAAIAIASARASLDGFVRAARPGISDETALRLRGSALAAGRAYLAMMHDLRKPEPDAAEATPAAQDPPAPKPDAPATPPASEVPEVPPGFIALQPGAKPIPAVEMFQPRDRFGKPIPTLRTDLMTRAQLRASLSIPRDPKLEAEALAEEAAMMAEQAALDARGTAKDKAGSKSG